MNEYMFYFPSGKPLNGMPKTSTPAGGMQNGDMSDSEMEVGAGDGMNGSSAKKQVQGSCGRHMSDDFLPTR